MSTHEFDLPARIEALDVSAYTIPTDGPESDGTFSWEAMTLVLVEVRAAGQTGLGYTYAGPATARVIRDKFRPAALGHSAFELPKLQTAMLRTVRNAGRPGVAAMGLSAVDVALWDLKARLLGTPLASLLGVARRSAPIYGSGGFLTYSDQQLCDQLAGWVDQGIGRVKMKVGQSAAADARRANAARQAIGPAAELMVDGSGAYDAKQALALAERLAAESGVTWFEEPVLAENLEGLRLLRERAPAAIEIVAGEYCYGAPDFRRMLAASAVDVLQADATRCGGVSGFLQAAAQCAAWSMPLSAHSAPAIHAHLCCAVGQARHLEYFYDHARIERLLFDGVLEPVAGALHPDFSRPGLGLELKRADAECWLRRDA